MPDSDGELIVWICENNAAAFDQLFYRYKNSLYRFALYLTQNKTEADDIFQEAWLRIMKYLPSSSNIRDFKAWILTVVVNVHRHELNKKKIRKLISPFKNFHPDER